MNVYVGNDNVVRLTGARAVNLSDGASTFLDGTATVTFRLQTPDQVDVAGETWPVTMEYILGSDGDFLGILRDTLALTPGTLYTFVGTADHGVDQHGAWRIVVMATEREA